MNIFKTAKKNSFNKGFTLIELLVVIAIIGILASIVLVSLNSARRKAGDASISANLANSRAQAELFYGANSNKYYVSGTSVQLCTEDTVSNGLPGIYDYLAAAQKSFTTAVGAAPSSDNSVAATWNGGVCHASPDAWVMASPLNDSTSGSPKWWCVDNAGFSGKITAPVGANVYACN